MAGVVMLAFAWRPRRHFAFGAQLYPCSSALARGPAAGAGVLSMMMSRRPDEIASSERPGQRQPAAAGHAVCSIVRRIAAGSPSRWR